MTSEIEALKTNEFLRRRKLRLQQVREQSKDIAKKIRQRAKVEKLRQTVDLDLKKQKEYLNRQGELVKKLENLYVQGIGNVGASHGSASEIIQDELQENVDLSKVRGKEAAAELRRKRQLKLDEQKKLLDRKLQAREAANELSREKSAVALKQTKKPPEDTQGKTAVLPKDTLNNDNNVDDVSKDKPVTNDMATQWGSEGLPDEWEPNIPTLDLPKDDRESQKETNNNVESKSDKSKRIDLFALSDEMPSSLRGRHTIEERLPVKPSLTLVSEYLQNRGLRLRESDAAGSSKKCSNDLLSIKQTIQRTRCLKPEGSHFDLCRVLDEQLIPVPSWQSEKKCEFCSHSVSHHCSKKKQFNVTNSQINKIFSSIRPVHHNLPPSPVLRGLSPFRRSSTYQKTFSAKSGYNDKSKSTALDSGLTKKPSVMIYNHSTRDARDIPWVDDKLVTRDHQQTEDAYSQAMRETSLDNNIKDKDLKRIQDARNKVAMTKQNIEKEYKDTINFLNSLPKDKGNKPIKTAYMDDRRQQMLKESRQHKLQQEYKKIEKDCRNHSCTKNRSKSKSPAKDAEEDFNNTDFQYSWMPVPESDGNLAVHTIPTTLKEGKSGNTVKFSKVDSYHEYRSRHKHTPPTKDTAGRDKQANKRIEAVIIEKSSSDSTEYSSLASDSSSIENIRLKSNEVKAKHDKDLSDAERIIIYKILDSKSGKKKCKNKAKLVKEIAKSLTILEKPQKAKYKDDTELTILKDPNYKRSTDDAENKISFEQINEGVYKTVNEKGLSYNVMNCYATNVELWQTTADRKPWWDNITSMYFPDSPREAQNIVLTEDEIKYGRPCRCNKMNSEEQRDTGTNIRWESGDTPARKPNTCVGCKCGCVGPSRLKENNIPLGVQPSATTSTSSFKTATNDKANSALPDSGYIKLIDEGGQEAGKFYIGASGFLKDDGYEVVIQLRKKDGSEKTDEKEIPEKLSENDTTKSNTDMLQPVSQVEITSKATESNNNIVIKPIDVGSLGQPPKWLPSNQQPIIEKPSEESIKEILVNTEFNENVVDPANQTNNLLDKGVDTQFQMSYAIPSHFPKTDPMPRPATSTYTQTSLSSPNHRPVFFHMSSSTSTAYMSPPEMVLPAFLRQNHRLTNEDMYDPTPHFNLQEKAEVLEQQTFSEEYEDCRCKRCTLAKKVSSNNRKNVHCCKKHTGHGNTNTPPNTVRSCLSEHTQDSNTDKKVREHKGKCRKSKIYTLSHNSAKTHGQENKLFSAANKRSRNVIKRINSSTASSYKNKDINSEIRKNICKTNLNPVIKKYVKKLLDLNKEGLKVVDVADQDCSSVATPSSSIINAPYNININKSLESKISLEQIKSMLKQQMLNDYIKKNQNNDTTSVACSTNYIKKKNIKTGRIPRKKTLHKVKSLNISKNLQKRISSAETRRISNSKQPPSNSIMENIAEPTVASVPSKTKFRSKSSPTPRQIHNVEPVRKVTTPDILSEKEMNNYKAKPNKGLDINYSEKNPNNYFGHIPKENQQKREVFTLPSHRASSTTSPDLEPTMISQKQVNQGEIPMNTSTQTNENVDSEINFTKLAEDKLQNMEKIADLTEKCTKRLSNLAKVLEEVRKNKSLAYSQISTSDSTSDSDQKSDKNVSDLKTTLQLNPPINGLHDRSDIKSPSSVSAADKSEEKVTHPLISTDFIPFLTDIPKPSVFKTPNSSFSSLSSKSSENPNLLTPIINLETPSSKSRGKPPPALSRINLKNGQENIVPHELSTVLEVDSPMSVKLKNQSSRDTKGDVTDSSNRPVNRTKVDKRDQNSKETVGDKEPLVSSDSQPRSLDLSKQQTRVSLTESSDESKVQMMDLKKFNEIMLKPFITFQEHAKKCNVALDEGSNLEDIPKEPVIDDVSSFHSDASLPDVIAELIKRNIIREPFKFDTASNVNSTTISSESTLSVLALSNMRKDKKKSSVVFKNIENVGETSDSLSISSNPDLENAFKKLGMRWASSTLKKTKERLALSSSSNTSSSSISQFKLKSFNNKDIPALASDSVSSVNISKNSKKDRNYPDSSKNAEQQTSLTNSMTVKEFLNNELAKKITFTSKSNRDDTEEEFVSLFETKMPEQMKHSSQLIREESVDSVPSVNNNRARTSTPVQLFKSMTYHSSSSSYISNGLFSNADDLSSVKVTSNSNKNHSTSEKDDLTVPNFSLKMKKSISDSKSD